MFAEDLTIFFNNAEHSIAATWTPAAGGGPLTLQVIFDNAYFEYAGGDANAAAREPICMASDVQLAQGAGIKRNDVVVINAISYKVAGIEPDGTGVTSLRLRV